MKKMTILACAVALNAFAAKQVIPKAIEDLNYIEKAQALFNKGIKGKTLKNLMKSDTPQNWFNLHHEDDQVEGVGSQKVYNMLGLPENEIIVAVIDSGVDVNHEDLQGKIWINKGEIANNGIDDDGNGYIDDVFGWNFIGGKDGSGVALHDQYNKNGLTFVKGLESKQVDSDTLEVTRELVRMRKLKETRQRAGEDLTAEEQEFLNTIERKVNKEYTVALTRVSEASASLEKFNFNERILKSVGFTSELTMDNLANFTTKEPASIKAKLFIMEMLEIGKDKARLERIIDYFSSNMNFYYNTDIDLRAIVGDNYADQVESDYGNNDIIGPDSSHGTHVSGIIAADRDNGLGMQGVATKVKIMAVRCVPNGDERDKDVANSIRYAVDNGAHIINMSFGKSFSPYKSIVNDAVLYAESKGVLLVHAAGNSNQNNNTEANFPNRAMDASEVNNWLEIGAASYKKGLNLPAVFSNFGDESVDVFAPGVDIYSTTPNNEYDTYSGTSMASPAAAGVAALIKSFKPDMLAKELRELMIQASRTYPGLEVYKPGTRMKVPFNSLSIHGSSVDAYNALK